MIDFIINQLKKINLRRIDRFKKSPKDVQLEVFFNLIKKAKSTSWGKSFDYQSIDSIDKFKSRVPISAYEDLFPYIERMMKGEKDVLWPSPVKWFAKSSGTTNARSKFIPVPDESLEECHYKGGKDMLSLYVENNPETRIFKGKNVVIGGSLKPDENNPEIWIGDVSALIMKNLPIWAEYFRKPSLEIATMEKWEDKLEMMVKETMDEDVTSIAGVPSWTAVFLKKVLEAKNKKNIFEVWPNLEVFFHGGVSFKPFRHLFDEMIPGGKLNYMEIYNASEGFFAMQDDLKRKDDLLLMLDYGIFYEFLPIEDLHKENPKTLGIEEVEIGKNYALIISTTGGLWRYLIGDTVKFTSLFPHHVRITGRTKNFINTFGEELVIDNAEAAVAFACQQTGAIVRDFTAGPIYLDNFKKAGHEWLIEFDRMPEPNLGHFSKILDAKLREVNSDYDAKRYKDLLLNPPKVSSVPPGTFYNWMKKRGKLGGQNKVPRLFNNREYIEDILSIL